MLYEGPRKIASAVERDDMLKIYVSDVDGEGTQITIGPGSDRRPAWSPDRARIAFDSDRDDNIDIYVVDTDGANLMRLTDNPSDDTGASWSADGSRIAFISERTGAAHLWVMDADGGTQMDLTPNFPEKEQMLSRSGWSPDGKQIAFIARGVWVVNSDGTEMTRITLPSVYSQEPMWSPDGNMIAVNSWVDSGKLWTSSVYVISSKGYGNRRVTVPRDIKERIRDEPLGWTADGKEIVFQRIYFGEVEKEELWSIDLKTGEETYIAPMQSTDLAVSWVHR